MAIAEGYVAFRSAKESSFAERKATSEGSKIEPPSPFVGARLPAKSPAIKEGLERSIA
jgi:hypothetical protein